MKVYTIAQYLSWTEIDNQLLILDTRDKKLVHELNQVGAEIWKMISSTPSSQEAIVKHLMQIYDSSVEQLQADVMFFLNELESAQLIEV